MWLLLGGIAAGALLVWGSPVWRAFPIHFGGDTSMHAAWASQLLDGEATPSAAITGQIPNYYPWMFHATLALAAVFMPNGHAVVALSPLQLALAMGTLLALFALGRSLAGGAAGGAGVALLAGATGGFGYFLSRGPTLLFSPRGHETDFGGDFLFVRSYNPAFYQLAPPFPRDLAFAFLVCALVLAVVGAPRVIDRRIWTYTGFRSVMYWVSVPHPGNESRIRWAGIYRHITPEAQRVRDNHILTYGDVSPRRWRAVARRYGVDVVVAYKGAADNRGFPSGGVRVEDGPYTVFRLSDCGS
jgi:hypothetical protein